MPEYVYKAADPMGKLVEGVMEANEERLVISQLQSQGFIPISVRLPTQARRFSLQLSTFSFFKKVSNKDVMTFTQQLSTLVGAGLPLDRSLYILIELTESRELKTIVENVYKAVRGGSSFADALAKHPRCFSKLYVNMVRAGEAGGVLELILIRLAEFLETSQELKDYITSAMVYPILLVLAGGGAITILMTFVIPKFAMIFSDMGQTLPLSTRFLLALSGGIRDYWWAILVVCGLIYWGIKTYINTTDGRLKWDGLKLKLVVVKTLVQKVEVARFTRTMGTLLRSGVPILAALSIVKEIVGNRVIANSLSGIYEGVKGGEGMAKPLKRYHFFPPHSVHMITVGEETGKLDEMLLKVADTYDKDVRNAVKRFVALLEPLMILIMGVVVGFIVISMLMAIFSVNEMPF